MQVIPIKVGKLVGHSGFFPGYLTSMGYLSEHRLALALQMNTSDGRKARGGPTRYLADLASLIVSALKKK